jgi:hypothetical protein
MTTERGPSGADTFSLRPIGWGRYIEVVFLGIWLVWWVAFEAGALAVLGVMLASLIAAAFGITLSFASRLTPGGAAPFFILFMIVWLTMWTFGGIAAANQFLRSFAGRDTVSVSPNGLEIEWRAGPFRRRRTIAHGDIRRVRLGLRKAPVIADTATGTVEITDLGTHEERAALLAWLQQRLVLPDEVQAKRLDAESAPPDWQVDVEGMETCLSWPTRRNRRIQAAILWGIAALLFAGCLPAFVPSDLLEAPRPGVIRGYMGAGVVSLLFVMWAAWRTWGRSEWVVAPGRLTWRRRFASWRRERPFEHAILELEQSTDSDGDDHFTLRVRNEGASRKISSAFHDDADLRRLAEWLSARTQFRMERRS